MPTSRSTAVDIPDDEAGVEFVKVKSKTLDNHEFHVRKSVNMYKVLGVFDEESPANLPKYLIDVTARRDQAELKSVIGQRASLTIDELFQIFVEISEAQAEGRPTVLSSESPNGSRKRPGSTRSAGT